MADWNLVVLIIASQVLPKHIMGSFGNFTIPPHPIPSHFLPLPYRTPSAHLSPGASLVEFWASCLLVLMPSGTYIYI